MKHIKKSLASAGLAGIVGLYALSGTSSNNSSEPSPNTINQRSVSLEQTISNEQTEQIQSKNIQSFPENPVYESNTHNLWNRPTIDPATINKVLARHKSPSRNLGQDLYDVCEETGADPAFILAMYSHESNFGKSGVATKTKAWGNVRPGSSWKGETVNGAIGKFRKYDTHLEGMKDMIDILQTFYINLETPEQIVNKYAPASENDVDEYVKQIKNSMDHFRALQKQEVNYAFTSQGVVELNKQDHKDWASGHLYIIKPGDMPQTIANELNTTWKAIEDYNKDLNHPVNPRKLKPKNTLYIPKQE